MSRSCRQRPLPGSPPRRQRGAATLMVGLLLLIGAGILSISATRTTLVEHGIAANHTQAIAADAAAQAGLDVALAWLAENPWTASNPAPTPPSIQSPSGESLTTRLSLRADRHGICVQAQTAGADASGLVASAHECYRQQGLFAAVPEQRMPPPLLLAGCLAAPSTRVDILMLETGGPSLASGAAATAACLPRGNFAVATWRDQNSDAIQDPDEIGASTDLSRGFFSGCPGTQCAWNQTFAMPYAQARALASQAGHRFTGAIPCGAPQAPGIYLIERSTTISALDIGGACSGQAGVDARTIGSPRRPVLLIVPEEHGCPAFTDVSIYGIVYYASTTACSAHGWGGARVHGAVIWEGNAAPPAAGSRFVHADLGQGRELNEAFQVVSGASRIPGTWRDWQ